MGSLSLGRPKWGGSTWAKRAQEGRAPGGASRKLPPSPRRSPRQEGTLGRSPRAAPSSKGGSPPPPPINRGGGGTPSTQEVVLSSPKGCPLSLPLLDPIY